MGVSKYSIVLFIIYKIERTDLIVSILFGYGAAMINIMGGFFSLKWSFKKSVKIFYLIVIGGMMARFLFIGACLGFVWFYTDLHRMAFVASLMAFYLILQFFEIRYINSELGKNRRNN